MYYLVNWIANLLSYVLSRPLQQLHHIHLFGPRMRFEYSSHSERRKEQTRLGNREG